MIRVKLRHMKYVQYKEAIKNKRATYLIYLLHPESCVESLHQVELPENKNSSEKVDRDRNGLGSREGRYKQGTNISIRR
jgi:hypothetical protein